MTDVDVTARAELTSVFIAESQERLSVLTELAQAVRTEGVSAERLAEIGRTLHNLKGAAATMGLVGDGFAALAHQFHLLEDLVLGFHRTAGGGLEESLRRFEAALAFVRDGLLRVAAGRAPARPDFPEDILARLGQLLDGVSAPAADRAPALAPPKELKAPAAPPAPTRASKPAGGAAAAQVSRGDADIDRLLVSAPDIDAVVRDVAWIGRGLSGIEERILGDDELAGDDDLARALQDLRGAAELAEERLLAMRLLPAATALAGLELETAELAKRLDKQVRLTVRGKEIRADRRTLQTARSLLRHLLRNAVDHAIESPRERVQQGKSAEGQLTITVEANTGVLHVCLQDDGRGFDLPAIRDKLAAFDASVCQLSDQEVLQRFAFTGGSTRAAASEVSGRGMGLSAVARTARAAGGALEIITRAGQGSELRFTLPLDVFAMDVLVVTVGGERCALPLKELDATVCLASAPHALRPALGGHVLQLDEQILPAVDVARLFGPWDGGAAAPRFAVVARAGVQSVALLVEELGSVQGVVPTPAAELAGLDDLVLGLARLADGALVAILSPAALVQVAPLLAAPAQARADAAALADAGAPRETRGLDVLLVEDSASTREVLRALLVAQGFRVRVAADGEEGLARLREGRPDVVVSDINMPRLDGFGLTRRMRADPALAATPVILLTSRGDDGSRAEGIAAGANAHLVKAQFTAAVLRETLARLGLGGR